MTVDSYSNLLALAGGQQPVGQPAKWTFFVSLALHLCVLTLIFGLRVSPKLERPLSTYHVSLVTLPSSPRPVEAEPAAPVAAPPQPSPAASASRAVEPVALPPAPATLQPAAPPRRQVEPATPKMPRPSAPQVAPVPAFPPPQEVHEVKRPPENPLRDALRGIELPPETPVPAFSPPQEVREVKRPSENPLRETLRGIELPPEAPKLGEVKPTPMTPGKSTPPSSRQDIQKLLSNLKVPEAAVSSRPAPEPPQAQKSLADEISKQLQAVQQPRPPESQPAVQAKATGAKKPETGIEVPGVAPNRYLALIQSKISNQWIAPPVDLSGKSLKVVVRFRLDRSGSISEVVIETSSGNGYYDDAGRRAVLKAGRLPSFPPEMTEPFLDTHFSFTVGEEAG